MDSREPSGEVPEVTEEYDDAWLYEASGEAAPAEDDYNDKSFVGDSIDQGLDVLDTTPGVTSPQITVTVASGRSLVRTAAPASAAGFPSDDGDAPEGTAAAAANWMVKVFLVEAGAGPLLFRAKRELFSTPATPGGPDVAWSKGEFKFQPRAVAAPVLPSNLRAKPAGPKPEDASYAGELMFQARLRAFLWSVLLLASLWSATFERVTWVSEHVTVSTAVHPLPPMFEFDVVRVCVAAAGAVLRCSGIRRWGNTRREYHQHCGFDRTGNTCDQGRHREQCGLVPRRPCGRGHGWGVAHLSEVRADHEGAGVKACQCEQGPAVPLRGRHPSRHTYAPPLLHTCWLLLQCMPCCCAGVVMGCGGRVG